MEMVELSVANGTMEDSIDVNIKALQQKKKLKNNI